MRKILLFILVAFSFQVLAQKKLKTDLNATQSIDGIVKEMLNIISGEQGKVRDWEVFRNLFLPSARFTVLYHDSSFPQQAESISLNEFIEMMQDEYYLQGFIEYETGKVVEEYNGLAHVFQSFYAKDSEGVEGRGVNSYQLVRFDDRWWIANVTWTNDSNGVKIPDKYLKN